MPLAVSLARALEDYELRGASMPAATSGRILRLYKQSGPPTADGEGIEADYPGYARQALPSTSAMWGAAGSAPSNKVPVEFPAPAAAGPHDAVGFVVITDNAGGWRLYGALAQPRTPQQGEPLTFTIDDLQFDAAG